MPLQSSGVISIADVITFTRTSASVVKPFSIGPASTQRALSFYYSQAFIIPSTFDVTANENADRTVQTTTTTNTNGASIFSAVGNIFSLRLNNSSSWFFVEEEGYTGYVNQQGFHIYDIQNIPAGSYKVGARYSAGPYSPSGQTVNYSLTRPLQSPTNLFSDSAVSSSTTTAINDNLTTVDLTLSANTLRFTSISNNNSLTPGGILPTILHVNILRIA